MNVKPSYDGHYRDLLTLLLTHQACAELRRPRIHVIFLAGTKRWLVVLDDVSDPADLTGLWPQGPGGRVGGPDGSFEARAYGRWFRAGGEDALASLEDRIRSLGCYPYRTTPDELAAMRDDPDHLNRAFERVISETLERWISMAEDRLRASGLPCLVMPGNDDPPWVRRLLDQAGCSRPRSASSASGPTRY